MSARIGNGHRSARLQEGARFGIVLTLDSDTGDQIKIRKVYNLYLYNLSELAI
jgi:hypothetical protein